MHNRIPTAYSSQATTRSLFFIRKRLHSHRLPVTLLHRLFHIGRLEHAGTPAFLAVEVHLVDVCVSGVIPFPRPCNAEWPPHVVYDPW